MNYSDLECAKNKNLSYVFFNCDENKTHATMNPTYNRDTYRNLRNSRRKLWQRLKREQEEGRICITEENWSKVRNAVLMGNPVDVNPLIQYGAIVEQVMY